MRERRVRNYRGGIIAEMPAALWLVFVGLLVPFIAMVTFGYRAALAYFAVRDATLQAAKQGTYTKAAATAGTAYTKDLFGGVSNVSIVTYAVQHPLDGSAETAQASPLLAVDSSKNLYFVRVTAVSSLAPIWNNGAGWVWGLTVPGLNAPNVRSNTYQVYFENPGGLTQ